MSSWIDFAGDLVESYGFIPALFIALLIGLGIGWVWKMLNKQPKSRPLPESYGCPICKYEYEKHVKTCPDCNVALVENIKESVLLERKRSEEKIAQDMIDYPNEDLADTFKRILRKALAEKK